MACKENKIKVYRIKPLGKGKEQPTFYLEVDGRHPDYLHEIIEGDMGGHCSVRIIEMKPSTFYKISDNI